MDRLSSISELLRTVVRESWLRGWATGPREKERQAREREIAELATRAIDADQLKSLAVSLGEDAILLIPRDLSGRHAAQDFWNVGHVHSIFAPWPGRLAYGEQFPVVGPPAFRLAVCRLLGELSERAPRRFQEALTHLPMAVHDPGIPDPDADGRADGRFAVDGAVYDRLRLALLHAAGHNVAGKDRDDWSEDAADDYVRAVVAELGESPRTRAVPGLAR